MSPKILILFKFYQKNRNHYFHGSFSLVSFNTVELLKLIGQKSNANDES